MVTNIFGHGIIPIVFIVTCKYWGHLMGITNNFMQSNATNNTLVTLMGRLSLAPLALAKGWMEG